MTVATVDDPVAANAMQNGGWMIQVPVQGQQADRRMHIVDCVSKLLAMLLKVVVPMTKDEIMGWEQRQTILIRNDHVMVPQ